jgi:hypothetical protein
MTHARADKWGRHDRRIAWLRDHPELWKHAPSLNQDVTDVGREVLNDLIALMTEEGLFGQNSADAKRESLRRAIGKAREQLTGVRDGTSTKFPLY